MGKSLVANSMPRQRQYARAVSNLAIGMSCDEFSAHKLRRLDAIGAHMYGKRECVPAFYRASVPMQQNLTRDISAKWCQNSPTTEGICARLEFID